MENKLYRDEYHKKIAGVCAGLAEYFKVDVAIVRVIFVLALIFHGGGLLVYVVFWIALPKKPYAFNDPNVDYRVPPQTPGGSNSFQGNAFQGDAFGSNPFPNQPFPNQPLKPNNSTSLVGIIFGVILIIVGASILLDDFDIIPDWDFERLWPIALVAVGAALILSGERKKPWEKNPEWHKTTETTDAADATIVADDAPETNPPADNPPAE